MAHGLMSIRKIVPVDQAEWRIEPPAAWIESREPDWDFTPPDGHGVAFLLVDEQHDVATHAISARTVRRLLTHSAVQALGQVELDFDPAAHVLIIHELAIWRRDPVNGWQKRSVARRDAFLLRQREQQLEQQILNGRLSLVALLEDVRVGDAIDMAWTLQPREPLPGFRFSCFSAAAWSVPVARAYFSVKLDPTKPVRSRVHVPSSGEKPEEQLTDDRATWISERPSIFLTEPNTPGWNWLFPLIDISGWADWAEVANFAAQLWADAMMDGAEAIVIEAARLRDGHERSAAALAAIRFVQEEVRYLSADFGHGAGMLPNGAGVVLSRRFGDCKDKAVLLTALLRALGFEAWPMLVSANWRDAVRRVQPSPAAFSHAIVTFLGDGRRFFIDPTFLGQGGDLAHLSPPPYRAGLEVRAGATGLLEIPEPATAEITLVETFQLDRKHGRGQVEQVLHARGPFADDVRAMIVRQGRTAFSKHRAETLQKHFPALVPNESSVSVRDDILANTIVWRAQHELRTWGRSGEKPPATFSYGAHGLFLAIETIDGPEKRRAPWPLRFPMRVQHHVVVRGRDVRKVNRETHKFSAPGFNYLCDVTAKRREVSFDYRWETTQPEVLPEEWPEYCRVRTRALARAGANVRTPSFWTYEGVNGSGKRGKVAAVIVLVWALISAAGALVRPNHPGPRKLEPPAPIVHHRYKASPAPATKDAAASPLPDQLKPAPKPNVDVHPTLADDGVRWGYNYTLSLMRAGRAAEAYETARQLQARFPGDPIAARALAISAANAGDAITAERIFKEWINAMPHEPYWRATYGYFLARAGRLAEARPLLEQATREFPKAGLVWLNYAAVLNATGEPEAAAAAQRQAEALMPPQERATLVP